jgi:hypothetical protein
MAEGQKWKKGTYHRRKAQTRVFWKELEPMILKVIWLKAEARK